MAGLAARLQLQALRQQEAGSSSLLVPAVQQKPQQPDHSAPGVVTLCCSSGYPSRRITSLAVHTLKSSSQCRPLRSMLRSGMRVRGARRAGAAPAPPAAAPAVAAAAASAAAADSSARGGMGGGVLRRMRRSSRSAGLPARSPEPCLPPPASSSSSRRCRKRRTAPKARPTATSQPRRASSSRPLLATICSSRCVRHGGMPWGGSGVERGTPGRAPASWQPGHAKRGTPHPGPRSAALHCAFQTRQQQQQQQQQQTIEPCLRDAVAAGQLKQHAAAPQVAVGPRAAGVRQAGPQAGLVAAAAVPAAPEAPAAAAAAAAAGGRGWHRPAAQPRHAPAWRARRQRRRGHTGVVP